ncbi:hypothetical protein BFW01_g8863 [Lasiodiplodia theobromae]|uniref:BTB domain-containing protein n=2 Tax=Lasiodiplodia TaxID=66739 RepID=A0A5N5DPY0_9PEZI|nr:uncharacterized protein LTHEOB_5667 [Lasiodiplodia theobromae]KAB2578952.1 hypothetical protein DBV05_g2429 [Lasiodiplodia theobromae]KAF4544658.1 hypothetical protein LTHEOB_5667 [Lasiodiplodia theobromae]KAF9637967.1 hypothetical protein BFW01_g8863 [Lasiodiplodia theobromae]KAK0653341.1 hypothetical protein DIS24_g6148 [Lasiodiplodia hormozganensis]
MVSYPDTGPADRQTLAIRPVSRAPSVASTSRAPLISSHRRHSRQIRSHAGGASYQPQNEFPVFTHTGDVEIIITSNPHSRRGSVNAVTPYGGATAPRREERFLLHRLILAQCSGFFDEETTPDGGGGQQLDRTIPSGSALARLPPGAPALDETGRRKRWRFELDWGENGDEMPVLVQKEAPPVSFPGEHAPLPPPVHNKPQAPSTGFFRSMAQFSSLNVAPPPAHTYDPEDDIFRDYANLFRIFYNYPPALDSVNIAQAYVECKTLLQLADLYDALEVIGPRVDHHLLRFQGRLFKQIAKYPPSYLKLGFLARSRVIYSEALVHVVGQWPVGANQLRGQIPQAVLEVIEDKADEMEELKTKIETKLFKLTLTTTRGERVNPSNGFIDWMALSLFRQWLAENTSRPPAPILKSANRALPNSRTGSRNGPAVNASTTALATTASTVGQTPAEPPPFNTGRVFRLIGTGGDAYLNRDELKRFLKLNAEFYTRENMRKFERRIEEIKNLAADVVKPLMRNYLELDMRDLGHGLPYLTCTKVDEQDFVWDE